MKRGFKKNSFMAKMTLPMIIVLFIQTFVIILAIILGGVFRNLDDSALLVINEKLKNRASYISADYFNKWSNLSAPYDSVSAACKVLWEENQFYDAEPDPNAVPDQAAQRLTSFYAEIDDTLIEMIRANMTTGAFLLFTDGTKFKNGLYIRDYDPTLNAYDNSDLFLQVASGAYTEISPIRFASSTKKFAFDFRGFSENDSRFFYYTKPIEAIESAASSDFSKVDNFAYLGGKVALNGAADYEVMTYTLPILDQNNKVRAILGVELDVQYLNKLLPAGELDDKYAGSYLFSVYDRAALSHDVVTTTGPYFAALLENADLSCGNVKKQLNETSYLVDPPGGKETVVVCQMIKIYNDDSVFKDKHLGLFALIERDTLFVFSDGIKTTVYLVSALSFLLCLFIIFVTSKLVTRPIQHATKQLRTLHGGKTLSISRTNIAEVDEFANALELLTRDLIAANYKTHQIIRLLDLPIATFEINETKDEAFYSDLIFDLFGTPPLPKMTRSQFSEFLASYDEYILPESKTEDTQIYCLPRGNEHKWLLMKFSNFPTARVGVLRDITDETLEKLKLEHERDYDGLTDLFNRRALLNRVSRLTPDKIGHAACIMMDLDNLKYINDNYGHDFGDTYIVTVANVLKSFSKECENSIVCRMAGDEFLIFLYGFQTRQEASLAIDTLRSLLKSAQLLLSDGTTFKVHASAGVSRYPEDSKEISELIKYADYAMYETKTSLKGEFHNFDYATYIKGSDLLKRREDLNSLIEKQLITFYFQPIISAATGEIIGYEALMRSLLSTFPTPVDIINAARLQYKLRHIETLSLRKSMDIYSENLPLFEGKKLFVNSISNQILTPEDIRIIEEKHLPLLKNLVLEFTESERLNLLFAQQKKNCLDKWGAQSALDDFASGYNSESVLLEIRPAYIKIDISIIHNLHKDENRQLIVSNIVNLAKSLDCHTIAEGVETAEELKLLVALGVDFLQGFYLARPAPFPEQISAEKLAELKRYNEEAVTLLTPPPTAKRRTAKTNRKTDHFSEKDGSIQK